jgi:hypothetical protein
VNAASLKPSDELMTTNLSEPPTPDNSGQAEGALTTSQRAMIAARLTMPEKGGHPEMVTTTMLVTPQQAQAWLDAMPHQRRVRQNKIRLLTRQVLDGRWKVTPHGIVFDTNGVLIDGQHRLIVVVQTGKSLPFRVTWNAPSDTYLVIDGGGSPKTLDDAIHHEGILKSTAVLAAVAIRLLAREERGHSIWEPNFTPSNEEGIETFRRNLGIMPAVDLAAKVRLAPSRGNMVYFFYKGMAVNEAITRQFADALATGELLRAGDPALLLRNTWIQNRASRVKRTELDEGIMIASALNAALKGRKMTSWRRVEFGKGKQPIIGK